MQYSSINDSCDVCKTRKYGYTIPTFENQFKLQDFDPGDCRCSQYKEYNPGKQDPKESLGQGWFGRILQGPYPHGREYHKDSDYLSDHINSYRKSLDECEGICGHDVCKEWGNRLERYYNQKAQGKQCKKPLNPCKTGCLRTWN